MSDRAILLLIAANTFLTCGSLTKQPLLGIANCLACIGFSIAFFMEVL